jgi:hypothetical protein
MGNFRRSIKRSKCNTIIDRSYRSMEIHHSGQKKHQEAVNDRKVRHPLDMTHQKFRKVQNVNRNGLNIKERVIESVAAMESSYYNVVAPASYGGLNKFRPKGYIKKPKTGYRHMMPTPCINQRDDDFPDVKW